MDTETIVEWIQHCSMQATFAGAGGQGGRQKLTLEERPGTRQGVLQPWRAGRA